MRGSKKQPTTESLIPSTLRIEEIDPRSLIPYERNNKKHPQQQIDRIANCIAQVGFLQPVVIDEKNVIIIGHGRTLAAVKLNMATIPVVRLGALTKAQVKWLRIFDNKISADAEWDYEAIGLELEELKELNFDLEPWGLEELLPDAPPEPAGEAKDDEYEQPEEVKTDLKRGDLITLGRHRVMCGDSMDQESVEYLCDSKRAEMVWTDPPYGVAVGDKNKWLNSIARSNRVEENLVNDTIDEDGVSAMLKAAFANAIAVCEPGAAWYVAAPPGPLHTLFALELKALKIWRQTIQWVKNNATFSPMGVDYHWQAEPIFYGWVPNAGHRFRGGRKQTTVWNIDRPQKSPEHPTMKPVELVARAIENSSDKGQIVLDLFLGGGSCLIAAEQLGRTCYGMEIEPKYCQVIVDRYRKWCEKSEREFVCTVNGEPCKPAT